MATAGTRSADAACAMLVSGGITRSAVATSANAARIVGVDTTRASAAFAMPIARSVSDGELITRNTASAWRWRMWRITATYRSSGHVRSDEPAEMLTRTRAPASGAVHI